MKAGRELDALVAEHVLGEEKYYVVRFGGSTYGSFKTVEQAEVIAKKIQGDFKAHIIPYYHNPKYSDSIADAWPVHQVACSWIFSKRNAYLTGLAEIVRAEIGRPVAWPDVMIFLKPEHICLAALQVVGVTDDELTMRG